MSYFVVDVEADGPIPADYSMVCFGAVRLDDALATTFFGKTRPIAERHVPEALAVSGYSREQHLGFDDPAEVMSRLAFRPHSEMVRAAWVRGRRLDGPPGIA